MPTAAPLPLAPRHTSVIRAHTATWSPTRAHHGLAVLPTHIASERGENEGLCLPFQRHRIMVSTDSSFLFVGAHVGGLHRILTPLRAQALWAERSKDAKEGECPQPCYDVHASVLDWMVSAPCAPLPPRAALPSAFGSWCHPSFRKCWRCRAVQAPSHVDDQKLDFIIGAEVVWLDELIVPLVNCLVHLTEPSRCRGNVGDGRTQSIFVARAVSREKGGARGGAQRPRHCTATSRGRRSRARREPHRARHTTGT